LEKPERQITVVNVYNIKKPEQTSNEKKYEENKAETAGLEIKKIIDELDKKYDFVSQEKRENENVVVVRLPCFMDYSNLPSFKIEEGLIKSINWRSIYSDMTIEEFKEYAESIDRYKKQLIRGISYIKN